MKIDENPVNKGKSGYMQNNIASYFTQMVYRMMILFYYVKELLLANENIRLVLDPSNSLDLTGIFTS
jgi:hypothetical protein